MGSDAEEITKSGGYVAGQDGRDRCRASLGALSSLKSHGKAIGGLRKGQVHHTKFSL